MLMFCCYDGILYVFWLLSTCSLYQALKLLAAVRRRSGKTCAASTRLKSFVDLDHLAMDSYTGTSFHFMVSVLFDLSYCSGKLLNSSIEFECPSLEQCACITACQRVRWLSVPSLFRFGIGLHTENLSNSIQLYVFFPRLITKRELKKINN